MVSESESESNVPTWERRLFNIFNNIHMKINDINNDKFDSVTQRT